MTNEEIKKEILHRVAVQKQKRQRVLRMSASVGCAAVVALAGVGLVRGGVFDQTPPVTDKVVKPTTTVTTAPTEQDVTTTTTTVDTTTTDGGVVAPTTTVTTVAPTQTTTKPTTGKTEQTQTTASTTTGTKDKLLITGGEPDDSLMQDASGAYMLDEISPLLKQTMEQYKDTDAVYAVLVAVNPGYNQKLVDDRHKAIDAFLESDEMVKLAEQRDLAREEWQAIDEERKANIGNEEVITTEFIEKLDRAKETYRSLRSEYEKRREDFGWAYWNAYVDEAIEVLAEFSDINLVSLYERVTQDWEKMEKKEIDVIMRVLSVSWFKSLNDDYRHGYAAVLSADEILTLSESDSYIFWLASCDEDTTSYLIDM